MAAKTSVFYLTERVTLAAGTNTENTDTIDLGAYVDVADRQGVLVHAVDFVFQGKDTNTGNVTGLQNTMANDATIIAQLTDLNRGELVFADDRSLVASGELYFDAGNGFSRDADLYPDNFGPTSAQGGRIVINDQMYVRARNIGVISANTAQEITVRIKCSVINLSQKDFMAIALQSTAADN
tara:strand:- start:962 stop:1507 length:546 start_codon:yes stop_codon:yes gene_type:complete